MSLAILECCFRKATQICNQPGLGWINGNVDTQDLDIGYLAHSPNGEWGWYLPIVEQFVKIPGTLIICEAIVEGCKTKVSNDQTTTRQESLKNYLRWN